LLHLFNSLHRLGTTVVMATHDWHLIDRITGAHHMHLEHGRLVDPEPSEATAPPGVAPRAEPPRSTIVRSGL
jgi:cell division transport system ATP-binding protein